MDYTPHFTGEKKGITLLGSTGSIGQNTLAVLARYPDRFEVIALSALKSVETLYEQCLQFKPLYAVMVDPDAAAVLKVRCATAGLSTKVLSGSESLNFIAALPEISMVMAGIVGGAGLASTLSAAKAGKQILLANKEALVMSGTLLLEMAAAHGALLIPVDSEHNALFQCMPAGYQTGHRPLGVEGIVLTASGGAFLHFPSDQLSTVTPEMACQHPNWKMGKKITVDCATLMNKGLEVIEASLLFQLSADEIEVVIHPQSVIHSLVTYQDGSFLAQLGTPDMQIPISYALSWPHRLSTPCQRLKLADIGQFTFMKPCEQQFPCLPLAYEAIRLGKAATTVLNAGNEVAVAAFLNREIPYTRIPGIITDVLHQLADLEAITLEDIVFADLKAREYAHQILQSSVCV